MSQPECPKCGRELAGPLDSVAGVSGTCSGGETCDLHARLNTMTALVRKLIDGPLIRAPATPDEKAQYRAILLVLDEFGGGPPRRSCPICGKTDVVVKGTIAVHFRSNEGIRPCPGSWKQCLAGYLL